MNPHKAITSVIVALILGAAATTISNTVYADGISGTYVGANPTTAFLIQIVQTSDGRLTGHYAQTTLQPDGKLQEANAAITGASDGRTVALTIQPPAVLSVGLSLSGTLDGSTLHISGGGNGLTLDLTLTKADESAYRAKIANLTSQAAEIDARHKVEDARRALENAKQALEASLTKIRSLTAQMAAFPAPVATQLAKFPAINQRYRTITEAMRRGLARQQSIYGDGQASVARSQIDVALNQAAIEANQSHLSVQSAYSDFDTSTSKSLGVVAEMRRTCQTPNVAIDDATLVTGWNAACLKFTTAIPDFQKHVGMLRDAYSQTESVWQQEHSKQESLMRSADRMN